MKHPTIRADRRPGALGRRALLLLPLLVGCTAEPTNTDVATAEPHDRPSPPVPSAPGPGPAPKPTPTSTPDAPAPIIANPTAAAPPASDEPAAMPSTRSGLKAADDAPPLVKVATRTSDDGGAIVLLPSTDGHLFAAAGPLLYLLGDDGSIAHDPRWSRGIDVEGVMLESAENGMFWWNASGVGGTWPDGAYLVLHRGFGTRGGDAPAELYRRSNALWTRIDTQDAKVHWYPRRFGAWKDGSLLALAGFTTQYSNAGDGDVDPPAKEVRAFESAVARRKKLVVLRGAPKAPPFGERNVHAFASLPGGEIFAVLTEDAKAVVLHHDGAGERTLALPVSASLEPRYLDVRATARDRAWVFGPSTRGAEAHGYLARFDGTTWTEVDTACESISSLSLDPQGTAYVVCPVNTANGEFTRVLLRIEGTEIEEIPTPSMPSEVVARGPKDVWVASEAEHQGELWHTGATAAAPLELPSNYDTVRTVLQWAEPSPLTDGCYQPWIPLVAGTDVAAANAKLEPLRAKEIYPEIVEAYVQDRTEYGVTLPGSGGKGVVRVVKSVTAALGDAAGTPSCNDRPAVAAEPGE